MIYGNQDHLRHLATAKAIVSLLAQSDNAEAVGSILCADDEAGRLAGVTEAQRLRLIDVMDGDDPVETANEIGNIIRANHGDTIVPAAAANLDLLRTLSMIEMEAASIDYSPLSVDPRKMDITHPHTVAAREALHSLAKIRVMAQFVTTLLMPPEPVDAAWEAAE
jgi:hypothetical protein